MDQLCESLLKASKNKSSQIYLAGDYSQNNRKQKENHNQCFRLIPLDPNTFVRTQNFAVLSLGKITFLPVTLQNELDFVFHHLPSLQDHNIANTLHTDNAFASKESIKQEYHDMFNGHGTMPGKIHIETDDTVAPIACYHAKFLSQ